MQRNVGWYTGSQAKHSQLPFDRPHMIQRNNVNPKRPHSDTGMRKSDVLEKGRSCGDMKADCRHESQERSWIMLSRIDGVASSGLPSPFVTAKVL